MAYDNIPLFAFPIAAVAVAMTEASSVVVADAADAAAVDADPCHFPFVDSKSD